MLISIIEIRYLSINLSERHVGITRINIQYVFISARMDKRQKHKVVASEPINREIETSLLIFIYNKEQTEI